MINIISNGSKWAGESPDPVSKLKIVLESHTLDSLWEDSFIEINPLKIKKFVGKNGGTFTDTDKHGEYITDGPVYPGKNVYFFGGNFVDLSHVFNIQIEDKGKDTKEWCLIQELTELIEANQATDLYAFHKKQREESDRKYEARLKERQNENRK